MAVGLTGEPDPPGAGSAVTVSMNVHRFRRAATRATSSRSATSIIGIPSELMASMWIGRGKPSMFDGCTSCTESLLMSATSRCLNHGITSTDADSAEAPFGGGDFIERYVFPHGELPHIGFLLKEMAAAGLEATDVENLRRHYALTARHWSRRFERNGEQLRALAGEKRYRIWRTYLAGCAYGFEQDWISLHQVLAVKAGGPGANPLPLTRDYIYAGAAA